MSDFTSEVKPTAPQDDEYDMIQEKEKLSANVDSVINAVNDAMKSGAQNGDEVMKSFNEFTTPSVVEKVVSAEADSSTSSVKESAPEPTKPTPVEVKKRESSEKPETSDKCTSCPYYKLACNHLSKIKLPPKVEEYILWKNPKTTGILFGTSLVLMICLASFSLMSVVSSLAMLTLTSVGAYRFYLAVIFRIKGTQDETFDKLSSTELSVPKEKMRDLTQFLETDFNRLLNQVKSIVLWDNITVSAITFAAFYFIYCIGSVFNTLTLMILCLVTVFTLPKVYQVYKTPIDAGLEKASTCIHKIVKQLMEKAEKLPFMNKLTALTGKKTQ